MSSLLMPKATAIWLVENTTLTFDQIAKLCGLHVLEIRGIADGELSNSIRGQNPVTAGQMNQSELDKAASDANYVPKILPRIAQPQKLVDSKRRRRYTPLSRRHDRPNAIVWLLRRYPNLSDSQIIRLAGTTRNTISSIRNRTHWNFSNLREMDPVTLGLCLQSELNAAVETADKRAEDAKARAERNEEGKSGTDEFFDPFLNSTDDASESDNLAES